MPRSHSLCTGKAHGAALLTKCPFIQARHVHTIGLPVAAGIVIPGAYTAVPLPASKFEHITPV